MSVSDQVKGTSLSDTDVTQSWTKRAGDVVVRLEDGVVTAMIDRPEVRNAISASVIEGLDAAVELARERQARVLVIRGSGGTFCAGADLRELELLRRQPARLEAFMAGLGDVLDRLETAPFPVVAVVEGHAVAGGCELLLACDVVIASATARIADRHLEYGLVPAAGSSVRLTHRLPAARASYLLLSADLLTGQQAAAWGLASCATTPERLEATVEQVVSRLASRSRDGAAAVKTMIGNARQLPRDEALRRERGLFLKHMTSPDAIEGLIAFAEHRTAVFTPDRRIQEGHHTR
jgi:enoyl-CoA hydratase/carnithine racemase